MEARKECEIPDNLYEAIRSYADTEKIIWFKKKWNIQLDLT